MKKRGEIELPLPLLTVAFTFFFGTENFRAQVAIKADPGSLLDGI
jgi:hypothetical protein